jgi:hypothetical protein
MVEFDGYFFIKLASSCLSWLLGFLMMTDVISIRLPSSINGVRLVVVAFNSICELPLNLIIMCTPLLFIQHFSFLVELGAWPSLEWMAFDIAFCLCAGITMIACWHFWVINPIRDLVFGNWNQLAIATSFMDR